MPRMNGSNRWKLCVWLTDNVKRLEEAGVNRNETARQATKELGFAVNRFHVNYACKATGVKWRSVSNGNANAKRIDQLEQRITRLEQRINQ